MPIELGSSQLENKHVKNKRVGLLSNPASSNGSGLHIIDHLKNIGANVTAYFGPEHGVDGIAQDMENIPNRSTKDNVPIYSLYGSTLETLSPTSEMLDQIDLLIIDLQDIGSRYYTYVWTTALCIKACAKNSKEVIICDRPNPINGISIEGNGIQEGFESFVGMSSIPVRHALTIGEISKLMKEEWRLDGEIKIIKLKGWKRDMFWNETGLGWKNPSPNMRSIEAAILYPGICLIEGTNLSEGRGTSSPFEIVGAPFIDSKAVAEKFNELKLPGIKAIPDSFMPTMQKWAGVKCNGVRWEITDRHAFKPYLAGLVFIWLVKRMYTEFNWRISPYEFVSNMPAIDLLTGSDFFRKNIESLDLKSLFDLSSPTDESLKKRNKAILY